MNVLDDIDMMILGAEEEEKKKAAKKKVAEAIKKLPPRARMKAVSRLKRAAAAKEARKKALLARNPALKAATAKRLGRSLAGLSLQLTVCINPHRAAQVLRRVADSLEQASVKQASQVKPVPAKKAAIAGEVAHEAANSIYHSF